MANPEHVKILKQGVEAWNQWRKENPRVRPKLESLIYRNEDLRKINFYRADLKYSNFSSSNMSGSNLAESKCNGANFDGVIFHEACLMEANLCNSNLCMADLTDADASQASLLNADLNQANLTRLDLFDAHVGQTRFCELDLRSVKGLNILLHTSPSVIDIKTIYLSQGQIPEVFLRGCGVPDNFITYMKSLTMDPIEYYSCFISYSHQDKSFARRLHDQLQAKGIRCWLDEKQLLLGDDIYEQVDRGIRMWDKVLLCCSKRSLTSWWVDNEMNTALEKEQQLQKKRGKQVLAIIPLNLDGYLFDDECVYPKAAQLRKRLAADFTGWENDNAKFEEQFERMVKALQTEGAREEAPVSKL